MLLGQIVQYPPKKESCYIVDSQFKGISFFHECSTHREGDRKDNSQLNNSLYNRN